MALEQARLFAQLGERNEEIARQKDELADRSDVIRDIVYALAHDLRTPLAAAHVTMNQALSGAYGELPDRYRSILRTALGGERRRAAHRRDAAARGAIRGRRGVDRSRAGGLRGARRLGSSPSFDPCARSRASSFAPMFRPHSLPTLGDPHEIRRAIINLVANALDATPRGGHVGARAALATRGIIAIAVEDDGYGVPEERREGLFQRFGGGHSGVRERARAVHRAADRGKARWNASPMRRESPAGARLR